MIFFGVIFFKKKKNRSKEEEYFRLVKPKNNFCKKNDFSISLYVHRAQVIWQQIQRNNGIGGQDISLSCFLPKTRLLFGRIVRSANQRPGFFARNSLNS